MVTEVRPQSVEFWFDPSCPWCWMTSRWLVEVSEARGFEVAWHPLSLMVLNEEKESNPHADGHRMGLQALRVIEAARQAHGDQVVGKLYTEIGERVHPGGRKDIDAIITESLAAAGLPAELGEAADAATAGTPGKSGIDAEIRSQTDHAMELAGPDVGVPIISIDGVAFFGPVVTPAPRGEKALQLFDGVVAAAQVEGFYELKRGRKADPQFDRAASQAG